MDKLEEIKQKIEADGHRILYITSFGSKLYGTSDDTSDDDKKLIFQSSLNSLILGKSPKSITYSSGSDNSRNNSEDIDIQGFSLQYFLELLRKGETNMIDILYSYNSPSMIFCHEDIKSLFENHSKLFSVKNTNSYIGYAIGQAKKYGIRGSRLGFVKDVYEYLCQLFFDPNDRLSIYLGNIISNFGDESYCFRKTFANDKDGLVLCGKVHMEDIKMSEFFTRIKEHYETYGERARQAEQNEGIDWKALSHALRAIYQTEELILTGKIKFPLDSKREILYNIKKGKVDYKTVEKLISEGIDKVKKMQEQCKDSHCYDGKFVENFLLSLYN